MNEGKKLLYSIVENKLEKLSMLDTSCLYTDGINLKELADLLDLDDLNFYIVTDNIILRVFEENQKNNAKKIKKNITSARDLIIGVKDYNLKINLTPNHLEAIKIFKDYLNKTISNIPEEVIQKNEKIKKIKDLKSDIDNNYLLNNFELIESVVYDYDNLNYDKNMLIIMKFINDYNLNLLKKTQVNPPKLDIQIIKRAKLDERIKDILDKLNIDLNKLPKYILSELKQCDVEEFINTYNILRKNKAENGGILHLIDKINKLYLIVILIYATPESIMDVISTACDENGDLDISLLKIIINNIPGSLLTKNNEYFSSMHDDYMKNYRTLKELGINIFILIQKCPLFMIVNNKTLDNTLKYLKSNGANKKEVINRCYKTLAVNPYLLIDNLEVMKKYNINIAEFFSDLNTNYNLLKISDLDKKLKYLKSEYDIDFSNLQLLNKIIITKVYRESIEGYVNWGEV